MEGSDLVPLLCAVLASLKQCSCVLPVSAVFPDFLAAPVDLVGGALGFITRLRHVPGEREPVIKGLGGPSVLGADAADASRRR